MFGELTNRKCSMISSYRFLFCFLFLKPTGSIKYINIHTYICIFKTSALQFLREIYFHIYKYLEVSSNFSISEKRRGGGVGLIILNSWTCSQIPIFSHSYASRECRSLQHWYLLTVVTNQGLVVTLTTTQLVTN